MSTPKHINKFYPKAVTSNQAFENLLGQVKQELGLEPNQLMYADSICCDDLNAIQYPEAAKAMLGPFKMGGLDGFPAAGVTGLGAFAHHVPDDGALVIFYGPHIGLSDESDKPGDVRRIGRKALSNSCGAALGALGGLDAEQPEPSDDDFQMDKVRKIFMAQKKRIQGADVPLIEATEVMYEAIEAQIDKLVAANRASGAIKGKVVLMGGVLINGDPDVGSYIDVRRQSIA